MLRARDLNLFDPKIGRIRAGWRDVAFTFPTVNESAVKVRCMGEKRAEESATICARIRSRLLP